jgi:hypothetical protein
MTILVKPFKPTRFRDEAIRAALEEEARAVAAEIRHDYKLTTATWRHEVKFEEDVEVGPVAVTIMISTDDRVYGYVDYGTRPHAIWAGIYTGRSNKRSLAFHEEFTPKAPLPGVIGSEEGRRGGKMIFRPYVEHPGTRAREFSKIITEKWRKKFRQCMEKALARGARESGHVL